MIYVYADGSSTGRSNRPGGYGWIIVQDGKIRYAGHGGSPHTTNNLMEMEGAFQGLTALVRSGIRADGELVTLVSDSQYVLGIASGAYTPTKNLEEATALRGLASALSIRTQWVRGHSLLQGTDWKQYDQHVLMNERCDQLARLGKFENTPESERKKKRSGKAKRRGEGAV